MSKRPRNASGSGSQGAPSLETIGAGRDREPRLISAEFVEFRKRHVKQNKEIIANNVNTKIAMAAVQAEVGVLRAEILEVRQRNAMLSRELRKRSMSQGRNSDIQPAQRQAVEAILAAVPALQQLLAHSLNVTPPTPESYPDWLSGLEYTPKSTPPTSCQMPLIYTTRPAAVAAAVKDRGLGTLLEGSECGSEVDVAEIEERRVRVSSKIRSSGLAPNSSLPSSPPPVPIPISSPQPPPHLPPKPFLATIAAAKSPLLSSPSSRASPRRKSRGGGAAKRRRESGLLLPIVPPIPAQHARKGLVGVEAPETLEVDQDQGSVMGRSRDDDLEKDEDAVQDLIGMDGGQASPIPRNWAKGKERAKRQESPVEEDTTLLRSETIIGQSAKSDSLTLPVSSGSRKPRATSEETGAEEGDGGNGGRGRRSRNSVVSYKEPSLNKKMRKPDGSAMDELPKLSNGTSISARSSLISGHSASSSSTLHTTDQFSSGPQITPTPTAHLDDPAPTSLTRRQKPTTSTSEPSAALRRKSTLPRPNRRRDADGGAQTDGDGTDDEELHDGSGGTAENNGRIPRSISGSGLAGTATAPNGAGGGSHRNRTSPRKSPAKQSSEHLLVGGRMSAQPNMKKAGGAEDMVRGGSGGSGSGRDPLVDRSDNGQGGKKASGGVGVGLGLAVGGGASGRTGEMRKVSG